MKTTNANHHNPVPCHRFPCVLDGREWPARTGVAADDVVEPDDEVQYWFSLDPRDHGRHVRPDELAVLSLTTTHSSWPSIAAEPEESRWM